MVRPVSDAALSAGTGRGVRARAGAAIADAIEEVLRYRSPIVQTSRVTAREVELGGQTIAQRQVVNVCLLSANHDERQFENPDGFMIDRRPNPHVAFGRGIHFCIGAPLARLESRVALGILLRRFSRLRVDRERPHVGGVAASDPWADKQHRTRCPRRHELPTRHSHVL